MAAPAGAGLALGSCAALLLVALNALAVPALRRARRRQGWAGRLARFYMNTGVATLLVGIAVLISWLVFGLIAGLLGAVGAGARSPSRRSASGSAALAGSVAGLLVWGFSFGQARVARTRVRVEIPGLAPALDGPARGADQRPAHRQRPARASGSRAWSSAPTRSSPT